MTAASGFLTDVHSRQQYYPEDSVIHKLDPRVKLFGTLVFVVMVFMINNVIGYGLITLFLVIVI